ncbi:MAG: hypothetical protein RIF37_06795 [Rhodospirillaceae bacterium]
MRRYKFRKATAVSLAAVYALLASFAIDVYVLCVHQDGESHVEFNHDIGSLASNSDAYEVLNCLADDCVDKAISDNSTVSAAKVLGDKRPDFQTTVIVWTQSVDFEVSFENLRAQSTVGIESDYATVIKPTTVLLT